MSLRYGCSAGALQGKNLFSSLFGSVRLGKEGIVPHSVVGPLWFSRALVRMRTGRAPLSGHTLESSAGHCLLENVVRPNSLFQ